MEHYEFGPETTTYELEQPAHLNWGTDIKKELDNGTVILEIKIYSTTRLYPIAIRIYNCIRGVSGLE